MLIKGVAGPVVFSTALPGYSANTVMGSESSTNLTEQKKLHCLTSPEASVPSMCQTYRCRR